MDTAEQKDALQRKVIGVGCGLMVLAVVLIAIEPTQVVVGVLTGEPFFSGRPARYWTRALSAPPPARETAVKQLEEGGKVAVPVLMQILSRNTSEHELQTTTVTILSNIGADAAPAGPLLIKAFRDGDSNLRAACGAAFPRVNVPPETAVPVLRIMLRSPHSVIASRALADYGKGAAPALQDLTELLHDTSRPAEIRWNSVRTIGAMGPAAASSVRLLTELLTDTDEDVRRYSAEALGKIGTAAVDEGLPALTNALQDSQASVRLSAVTALGMLGQDSRPALESIRKLLEDPDPQVRRAASKAVQEIAH